MNMDEDIYEEAKKAAKDSLALIDPQKPFGRDLFEAIARVSVSAAFEAVCVRENPETKRTEVLLVQRPADDTAYPGEWHCPGSVLRPGESVEDVFRRIGESELAGKIEVRDFAGISNNPKEKRGHFYSVIYVCDVTGIGGTWYPSENLPVRTIKHHRNVIIPIAIKKYLDSEHS